MSNQHNYKCPGCTSKKAIAVRAHIWVALSDDGTDADDRRLPSHDVNWEDDYEASCMKCGWEGKVADLGSGTMCELNFYHVHQVNSDEDDFQHYVWAESHREAVDLVLESLGVSTREEFDDLREETLFHVITAPHVAPDRAQIVTKPDEQSFDADDLFEDEED